MQQRRAFESPCEGLGGACPQVNRLIDTDQLHLVCCVVVDEVHMVGDAGRGEALELLLTKLRFACKAARRAHLAALEVPVCKAKRENRHQI